MTSAPDAGRPTEWIGRSETVSDLASWSPIAGLAALLDYETPPWPADVLPPLGHWLHFSPHVRQSLIDVDGHPRRGGFLPPIALPRRMWAGGRLEFLRNIPIGSRIARHSTIKDVAAKTGASGPMVFVKIRHDIFADGELAVVEDQDLVYRELLSAQIATKPSSEGDAFDCPYGRTISLDSKALFRFSALTFNSHRIHYDREYARGIEHYPGLVVHGPLLAMLLMDAFTRQCQSRVATFTFRAQRPAFEDTPLHICVGAIQSATPLCVLDAAACCMRAEVGIEAYPKPY